MSAYDGLAVRLRGDGQRYKFILRCDTRWDGPSYCQSFDTSRDQWQTIRLPWEGFRPTFRARTVPDGPPLNTGSVTSIQMMLSKFEYDGELNPSFREGRFELPVASISTYMLDRAAPRLAVLAPEGSAAASAISASGVPWFASTSPSEVANALLS